jgi:putative cofactor-binding repeat protein
MKRVLRSVVLAFVVLLLSLSAVSAAGSRPNVINRNEIVGGIGVTPQKAIGHEPDSGPKFKAGGGVVNVDNYGCKGDGVTDDAPCIRAAYNYGVANYPNGFTIQGGPTKRYFVDSNTPTHVGCDSAVYFCFPASNVTFKDMYIISGGIGSVVFENHHEYPWTPMYSMQPVNRGDTTVTLTTASDASHFAVGDLAFLRGGVYANYWNDLIQNKIVAINGSTGVLSFEHAFEKPLNVSTYEPMQIEDVQSATTFNQTFDHVTIMLGAGDTGSLSQASANIRLENVDIEQASPTALNIQFWNEIYGSHIENSKFVTQNCAANGISGGDAGSSHGFIEHNEIIQYGCSTHNSAMNPGEGFEDLHVSNNTVEQLNTGSGTSVGLYINYSWDVVVSGNTIYVAKITSRPIASQLGCVNCVFSGNTIYSPIGAPNVFNGQNDQVTGNNFYNAGLDIGGSPNVTGNTFYYTAAPSYGVIVLENAAAAFFSNITGNTIVNSGSVTGNGIYVSDPGSPQTYPLTLVANTITGFTTPIYFAGSASANLTKRVVQGNSGGR